MLWRILSRTRFRVACKCNKLRKYHPDLPNRNICCPGTISWIWVTTFNMLVSFFLGIFPRIIAAVRSILPAIWHWLMNQSTSIGFSTVIQYKLWTYWTFNLYDRFLFTGCKRKVICVEILTTNTVRLFVTPISHPRKLCKCILIMLYSTSWSKLRQILLALRAEAAKNRIVIFLYQPETWQTTLLHLPTTKKSLFFFSN